MESKKVIDRKNLPSFLPVFPALTTFLALDHWDAPEWLFGVFGLFFAMWFITAACRIAIDKKVDVLSEEKRGSEPGKSKFQEFLDRSKNPK